MKKTTKAIIDELKYIKKDLEWWQNEYESDRDKAISKKCYGDAAGWDKVATGMLKAAVLVKNRISYLKN